MSSDEEHIHSFDCLGNDGSSSINVSGVEIDDSVSGTIPYVNPEGQWVFPNGEQLNGIPWPLQASPMDWVLSPMRYDFVNILSFSARYEIRINCDWCGIIQSVCNDENNYDSSGLLLNVEKVRETLVGQLYNNPNSQQTNGEFNNPGTVSVQWKSFIETILHKTAWKGVENSSQITRRIDLNKVKSELTYVPNINYSGIPDPQLEFLVVNSSNSHRCIMGLYQDTEVITQPFDHESIGQLINNTNVQDILTKLRNFGAFGGSLSVPEINPLIGIVETNESTETYRLFNRGDTIVFPINIQSIIGHTRTEYNESFQNGYSFVDDDDKLYHMELQIAFKQSVDTDNTILPAETLDEWEYHDTLRWHEPSRTFQTIRYDQNENAIIYTPTYNENGERIDVETNA